MLPINAQYAALLQSSFRIPRVYLSMQIPVVAIPSTGSIDPAKLGAQLIVKDVLAIRHIQQLDIGSNTCDVTLANQGSSNTPASINLAPNSDTLVGWTINGPGVLASNGPGGSADLEYTGTGANLTGNITILSPAMSVSAGQTVSVSWYVDPSHITHGNMDFQIIDANTSSTLHDVGGGVTPGGLAQRYAIDTYTIPSGTTAIKIQILCWNGQSGGFIVASGQKLKFSQPQVQLGTSSTGYIPYYPASLSQPGSFSPISNASPLGRFFYPGALDNKMQVYMGLANGSAETIFPKGVFIQETFAQQSQDGSNQAEITALDQMLMFQGDVYTQFPPRLYGSQTSAYYNPSYALSNAAFGDLKTYSCDATMWMQNSTDSAYWASDFVQVQVYSSLVSGGATPVPNSGTTAYTIDYQHGTITFTNARASNEVISVDARPLAMAPEKMLYHLFVDFAGFDPNFLKLDQTGILLPVMEHARGRQIFDIASEIALCTGPRGTRWKLYFDENGFLRFTEGAQDGPPVRTLIDTYDLLSVRPELQTRDIKNVIRATARASNDQQLTAIAYDVRSISTFGQKPTYDIPTQLLATICGMDPAAGINYMNNLVNASLFELSNPTIAVETEIVPDYSLQVGDPIQIIESKTGLNHSFFINQITSEVSGDQPKMTLSLVEMKRTQDYMFGLQSATGLPNPSNPLAVSTQSGLISGVTMQNGSGTVVNLVTNGQPNLDNSLYPVIFNWTGGTLNIGITLAAPPTGSNSYIWRWMYIMEDAYVGSTLCTGDGTAAGVYSSHGTGSLLSILANMFANNRAYSLPSDVLTNSDTGMARRYYWPLLRASDWVTNDGVTAYGATTLNSSWTGSVGATNPYLYGNLRAGMTDSQGHTTSGFVGVQLYATGTPAASALGSASTVRFGVDFGPATNKTINAGIKRKLTPVCLCILVANTAGGTQFKRIPFMLAL